MVHAVSADSALLGLSADIHLNPVVKLADAHIFAANVVFDIGVEQMYQKYAYCSLVIYNSLSLLSPNGRRHGMN